MPRTRASGGVTEPAEPEKPSEIEEESAPDNDMEEQSEEEVEYEEIEEEVEEEEEEEEEEEVEEEEEEEDAENDDIETDEGEKEEKKKHAELLALPPQGSEVYIGGISQNTSSDDLKHFCESVGEVTEVRIMKGKDSSENKGYAFVTFRTKELASRAIKELNNTEFNKGRKIKCSTSQAKNKLFIGNVPKNWEEEDMKKVVEKAGPGVIAVELSKDPQSSKRNRGFAFIEYYNHACAEYSRQNMSSPKFKLDGKTPTVSWPDPKNEESASQVKAVYVKNLPKNVTQEQLKETFEHHGEITKIVLPPAKPGKEKSRYGFVHFAERSDAMKALKSKEKYEIGGQLVECSIAKPQSDHKSGGGSNAQNSAILPTYAPPMQYGLMGSPYGAMGAGYGGAGFAQPLMYGRGGTAGMAMMPMLLPDGRIGYVLQQPGMQMHTPPPQHRSGGRSSGGGSSSGGRRGNDGNRGRRYNPY